MSNDVELGAVRVRVVPTAELGPDELLAIRALMDAAFGSDEENRFDDDDWQHALGGTHVVAELDGAVVAHASVVGRELRVDGGPLRTGYVEAVATTPALQGRGLGSLVMRSIADIVRAGYELGALGTGEQGFYERLGWQVWRGPTFVRARDGHGPDVRTPDEDGGIMVLATPSTGRLDLDAPISCEWRPGDVW